MNKIIKIENLSVGYEKKSLIKNINLNIEEGQIITLIGANGSGKSTILKTLTKQLKKIEGSVYFIEKELSSIKEKEFSKLSSIVTTDKLQTEYLSCKDVIATGRFPYTNHFGILQNADYQKVEEAINIVHAQDIAEKDFMKISDGQRQRVLLARAICQDTKIIILDEPTSFLDMFYKLDLLKTIHFLAKTQKKTIIMSLHELDLVKMISDLIICVSSQENAISKIGTPQEIFRGNFIQKLFGLQEDEFDVESCCLKLQLQKN